jgi:hypothetical protein
MTTIAARLPLDHVARFARGQQQFGRVLGPMSTRP